MGWRIKGPGHHEGGHLTVCAARRHCASPGTGGGTAQPVQRTLPEGEQKREGKDWRWWGSGLAHSPLGPLEIRGEESTAHT